MSITTKAIWLQDFPKKDPEEKHSCDFEDVLADYLRCIGVDSSRIRAFNFAGATASLISSVPVRILTQFLGNIVGISFWCCIV